MKESSYIQLSHLVVIQFTDFQTNTEKSVLKNNAQMQNLHRLSKKIIQILKSKIVKNTILCFYKNTVFLIFKKLITHEIFNYFFSNLSVFYDKL